MRIASVIIATCMALGLAPSAFAAADWASIDKQIVSIKPTFDSEVGKANASKTLDIYSQLDALRAKDEVKFLSEFFTQTGDIQAFVCRYIAARKLKSAAPTLVKIYDGLNEKTETPFLRDLIVSTVADIDGTNNRKFFLRVLPSKNIYVRRAAVNALGNLPADRESIVALRSVLLNDGDADTRRDAAYALGNFPNDQWAKQGLEQAQGDQQRVMQAVKSSLEKFQAH